MWKFGMRDFAALLALVLFLCSSSAYTQDTKAAKVGTAPLEKLAGKYDIVEAKGVDAGGDLKAVEIEGSMDREVVLKGHFVRTVLKAKYKGLAYEGRGHLGYDRHRKEYVEHWIDDQGKAEHIRTGDVEFDKNKLVLNFEHDGKKYQSVYEITDGGYTYQLRDRDAGKVLKAVKYKKR